MGGTSSNIIREKMGDTREVLLSLGQADGWRKGGTCSNILSEDRGNTGEVLLSVVQGRDVYGWY